MRVAPAVLALAASLLAARPSSGVGDADPGPAREVVAGTHVRVPFERGIERIAVGDEAILDVQLLSDREGLLLGKRVGRTSVMVWFDDASVERFVVSVVRDLSVLIQALHDIHPAILIESAPDRDALVLRGTVPDVATSRAAEAAARDYLAAGGGGGQPLVEAGSAPAPGAGSADGAPVDGAAPGGDGPRVVLRPAAGGGGGALAVGRGTVINLLRVATLPQSVEERVRTVIAPGGGARVRVRRIVRGEVRDDAADTFVLEGQVRDQVTLTRILTLAAHVVEGAAQVGGSTGASIRVLTDEGGSLGGDAAQGGGSGGGVFGSRVSLGSGGGSGGTNVDANVARAKVLSAAGGRILSFIEVTDLPQVRVDTRIYEINRSRLMSYQPALAVIAGDFTQAQLLPPDLATALQGSDATGAGGRGATDVLATLAYLAGNLAPQLQIAGSRAAVEVLFSLLEREGIARSLSQPSITVLAGENAQFQVGGEVPVPISYASPFAVDGGGTNGGVSGVYNSVQFVSFGIQVAVRPLVDENDVITLQVTPEVIQPDPRLTASIRDTTGTALPTTAFETRSLSTNARVEDGQAMLMGGLLSRVQSRDSSFTPGLHQVPVLGWLTKGFADQDDDLELVVVVSPTILRKPNPSVRLWAFDGPDPGSGNSEAPTGTW